MNVVDRKVAQHVVGDFGHQDGTARLQLGSGGPAEEVAVGFQPGVQIGRPVGASRESDVNAAVVAELAPVSSRMGRAFTREYRQVVSPARRERTSISARLLTRQGGTTGQPGHVEWAIVTVEHLEARRDLDWRSGQQIGHRGEPQPPGGDVVGQDQPPARRSTVIPSLTAFSVAAKRAVCNQLLLRGA